MRNLSRETHRSHEGGPLVGTGDSPVHHSTPSNNSKWQRATTSVAATTIVRVTRTGKPGLDEIFPSYDFTGTDYADIEVVLRVVKASTKEEGKGELELSVNASRFVSKGWIFSAFPWTELVRGNLVFDLMLYSKFEEVPPNPVRSSARGTLLPGEAFVILSFDPTEIAKERQRGKHEPGSTSDKPTRPARPSTLCSRNGGRDR